MEDLIKHMSLKQLIELLNDCTDERSNKFPYIMDNDDEENWEKIQDCMDAYRIATAVSNGRFLRSDHWLIVDDDKPEIFTFSDKETLFKFVSPAQIAELCKLNGIVLTISYERL